MHAYKRYVHITTPCYGCINIRRIASKKKQKKTHHRAVATGQCCKNRTNVGIVRKNRSSVTSAVPCVRARVREMSAAFTIAFQMAMLGAMLGPMLEAIGHF